MLHHLVVLLLLILHFLPPLHGTLLFTDTSQIYAEHAPVPLRVNKITSTRTGIPYSYYSLPLCTPSNTNYDPQRDLAATLRGDHLEDSLYEIKALETIDCRVINYLPSVNDSDACTDYDEEKLEQLIEKIKLNYTVHWTLDSLPAAVPNLRQYPGGTSWEKQYTIGFPLGYLKDGTWINNHVDINIVYRYAPNSEESIIILGFETLPRSQWYDPNGWSDSEEGPKKLISCPYTPYQRQSLTLQSKEEEEGVTEEKSKKIFWTYSVHWELNADIEWDARWDIYLYNPSAQQIHVISIMNALIIVFFMMVPVVSIVKRTVFDDNPVHYPLHTRAQVQQSTALTVYHELALRAHHTHAHVHEHDGENDEQELSSRTASQEELHHFTPSPRAHHAHAHDEDETRWRLLGVEVLRAPAYPMALSVLVGSGTHVICMMLVVIIFGLCGYLLPAEQGSVTVPLASLLLAFGLLSGFCAMQSYKVFRGTHRWQTAILTALSFPVLGFLSFLASVIAMHTAKSSGALPYLVFTKVLVLWFGISTPLVLGGCFLGYLKRTSDTRVHNMPTVRSVNRRVWYQRPLLSILFAGVLPFGVVVIEYFFILNSLWDKPIYDSYRYLLVSLVSLFITSASTNLVACFYQLNSGDPRWWWRPFLHGGASTFYMLIYSIVILFASFNLQTPEAFVLYFSFSLFSCSIFFLLTSTVGFATCYFFVQTIYKHVHLLPVN